VKINALKYCFLLLFLFYWNANAYSQDQKAIDQLLDKLKSTTADTTKVKLLTELSWEYLEDDSKRALQYAQQALDLAKKKNYKYGISLSYGYLGLAYDLKGDYPKALLNYFQSLRIQEEMGDKKGMAASYDNIGLVQCYMKQYDSSIDYLTKGLKLEKERGSLVGQAQSYLHLGIAYRSKKDPDKALENYMKSKKIYEQVGDDDLLSSVYNNIGNLHLDKGDQGQALAYYLKSLDLDMHRNRLYSTAVTQGNIADVYRNIGDYEKSLEYALLSLESAEKIQSNELLKSAFIGAARTQFELKQFKRAYENFVQYVAVKDTLYNIDRSKQIAETEAKYQSEKKDEKLKLQEKEKESDAEKEKLNDRIISGLYFFIPILILALIFIISIYVRKRKTNRLLTSYNKAITEQKEVIEAKNTEITSSIKYAQRIQEAILPGEEIFRQHFRDAFVLFSPKDIVSGDFYWSEKSGDSIIFSVADCTGHGVPGAFMSLVGHNYLSKAVKEQQLQHPSDILEYLHNGLQSSMQQKEAEKKINDGMDLAVCSLNRTTQVLEYAGANNPLWVISDQQLDGTNSQQELENKWLNEFKADRFAIGSEQAKTGFTNHSIQLKKGDLMYIFSDGFADQFGGEKGKKFMNSRFKELLLGQNEQSMQQQKELLEKTLQDWKTGNNSDYEQLDDICVIGIQV
jgi:serine phosphatase RsbU (regulator of sigma subunit)